RRSSARFSMDALGSLYSGVSAMRGTTSNAMPIHRDEFMMASLPAVSYHLLCRTTMCGSAPSGVGLQARHLARAGFARANQRPVFTCVVSVYRTAIVTVLLA